MSDPANFTPARYACKGRVYDSADGELNVVLAPIQDDGTLGPDKYYQLTKGTRWLRAGAVYEIPTTENGSTIQALNAKYTGKWGNTEDAAAWQFATQAAEAEDEMIRAHKREADGRAELLGLLRPLRALYARTIGTSRKLALEIALLNALRTPLRKGEGE
jgi:hypothetical protein